MARVGLCEDDAAIRRVVNDAVRMAGHEVVSAHNGGEAIRMFVEDDALEVIILDIGLPDADGRDVCQALRSAGQSAPVLFLTALGAVHERLAGFSAGADDYLPKPFDVLELIARVEALAKRGRLVVAEAPSDLVLDPARHSVACKGQESMLTPTEFRMLAAITSRPGEVVRRRAVVAAAWPNGGMVSDNTVDSYIRRIRVKLREVESPLQLTTVRGVGYTLR
ncbi:MAG TPA: response regulator transcription factor [Nocardioides sp.]|uniref:response regulator transcription factor n=1 Tax=uncultured Nocardioides sp. TaxID=198441 RepID=UPI000EC45A76|nr:response regulator transcription factor [uncultured Nocardioides sp.]HCB05485.1 DNA-binding response regulator [Nocardioides sp.]HRD61064.1 response regulator transcription factor [Nocardioides sp.]HRI96095.1 response regulator transcription factor [Nocardioides sp.]HRK46089.1 response regulator transcription factor [Nocardioides sp.]